MGKIGAWVRSGGKIEGWEKRPRESRGDLSLVPGSVGIAAVKSAEKFKSLQGRASQNRVCRVGDRSHRRKMLVFPESQFTRRCFRGKSVKLFHQ